MNSLVFLIIIEKLKLFIMEIFHTSDTKIEEHPLVNKKSLFFIIFILMKNVGDIE